MKLKKKTIFQLVVTLVCGAVLAMMCVNLTPSLKAFYPTEDTAVVPTYASVIVQDGDSLSSLAQKYNLSWQGLYCANKEEVGSDPNLLKVGVTLVIKSISCPAYSGYAKTAQTITTAEYSQTGTPQSIAWSLLASFGGDRPVQYACLNNIIMGESSWSVTAENPSGAYGIPQALPGDKMGPGWQTSAYAQLYWMIKEYIPSTYGTPCDAWVFHLSHGYY